MPADRNTGVGPFSAGKCAVFDNEIDGAAVFDAEGQPFCLIGDDMAIGGRQGAIARAQRIAESINRTEKHAPRGASIYAIYRCDKQAEPAPNGHYVLMNKGGVSFKITVNMARQLRDKIDEIVR